MITMHFGYLRLALLFGFCMGNACAQKETEELVSFSGDSIDWPWFLVTLGTDSKEVVVLLDPNSRNETVLSTVERITSQNRQNNVAVWSKISGVVCQGRLTFSCKSNTEEIEFDSADVFPIQHTSGDKDQFSHKILLDLNPYDGIHLMYFEPHRLAVWIVNLKNSKAKLLTTLAQQDDDDDTASVVDIKLDWANGLLFTTNTSAITIYKIQSDKLQLHQIFSAKATFLAFDSELRLLYWTDSSGSIYKRHYDQSNVEQYARNECKQSGDANNAGINPLNVQGSVFCIQNSNETLTLKLINSVKIGSQKHPVRNITFKNRTILSYNVHTRTKAGTFNAQFKEFCDKCSHICIPVSSANRFECACPYRFRLINEFQCETPAVLAVKVTTVQNSTSNNSLEGESHALLLHDLMAVPPSTQTYATENTTFRIVLSDTFQQLCLHFKSNDTIECFSPFIQSSRILVWTSTSEDFVLKVTGTSDEEFHVFYFRGVCLYLLKTSTNQTYALECRRFSIDFEMTFIDHQRWLMYFVDDSDNTVSVVNLKTGLAEPVTIVSSAGSPLGPGASRQFFIDLHNRTAIFFSPADAVLSRFHLTTEGTDAQDSTTRPFDLGTENRQLLIYRNNVLYSQDSQVFMLDLVQLEGRETVKTFAGTSLEFTIVEKSGGENKSFDPCHSQKDCPHLCMPNRDSSQYSCWCPVLLSLNDPSLCRPAHLEIAVLNEGFFQLQTRTLGDVMEVAANSTYISNLVLEDKIFIHESPSQRVCTVGGNVIHCLNNRERDKSQVLPTDTQKIIKFVEKHPGWIQSERLYWLSNETTAQEPNICLHIGSPLRQTSMKLVCFPENSEIQNPIYLTASKTLIWLRTVFNICSLRAVRENNMFGSTGGYLIDLAHIESRCFAMAVNLNATKVYILTWDKIHEYDMFSRNTRLVSDFDQTPTNVMRMFNNYLYVVNRRGEYHNLRLIGPLVGEKVENIAAYNPESPVKIIDVRLVQDGNDTRTNDNENDCTFCEFFCDREENERKLTCLCPVPPQAALYYGAQYRRCGNRSVVDVPVSRVMEDDGSDYSEASNEDLWWQIVLGVFGIVIAVGACNVLVWRQMKRRQEQVFQQTIQDFVDGNETKLQNARNESERAIHLPFTAIISPEHLKMTKHTLGEGNFGQVFKGEYQDKQVAVKTVKDNLNKDIIRDFLKELKIMAHVGRHENIVEFLGAEITEIRRGLARVVLELCEQGSLESVLRRFTEIELPGQDSLIYERVLTKEVEDSEKPEQRPLAYDIMDVSGRKNWSSCSATNTVSENQLRAWARQIASGMDYLEQKHVVHGDLAARNVLVCDDMTVKISDFGFSKNMYQTETYRKKKSCPLPWRWASPETLIRFEFSFKADVWSYGVTVWEIFSLGAVPFPDLTWDNDFVNKVQEGLRPPQPPQMPPELYAHLMACWSLVPSDRPSFNALVESWST